MITATITLENELFCNWKNVKPFLPVADKLTLYFYLFYIIVLTDIETDIWMEICSA